MSQLAIFATFLGTKPCFKKVGSGVPSWSDLGYRPGAFRGSAEACHNTAMCCWNMASMISRSWWTCRRNWRKEPICETVVSKRELRLFLGFFTGYYSYINIYTIIYILLYIYYYIYTIIYILLYIYYYIYTIIYTYYYIYTITYIYYYIYTIIYILYIYFYTYTH